MEERNQGDTHHSRVAHARVRMSGISEREEIGTMLNRAVSTMRNWPGNVLTAELLNTKEVVA